MGKLNKRTLWAMFWRLGFLQAAFNFERNQNLGFCCALSPALRKLYEDPEKRAAAVSRHLEYFNTHPYLAAVVVGMAVHLEEACARGEAEPEAVGGLKARLMGTYGALGDAFFWGAAAPAAALVALLVYALHPLAAAALFLLSFNIPHLVFIAWGLAGGYIYGPAFHERLRRLDLTGWTERTRAAAALLAGAAAGYWLLRLPLLSERESYGNTLLAAAAAAAAYPALRRGFSPAAVLYGAAAGGVLLLLVIN